MRRLIIDWTALERCILRRKGPFFDSDFAVVHIYNYIILFYFN